ncbi:MAG: NADH:flavin oxidoreductase [bacterium]
MLFDPIRLGPLTLENRLLRSATWEGMAEPDGAVTDRVVALYDELARGGAGLIITGFAYVVPAGKALPGQLGIYQDDQISGLRRIADAVHNHGGRAAVQLVDAGVQTRSALIDGRLPRGPSALTGDDGAPLAEALGADELAEVIDAFGQAAARVREAGFDAVQLHLAHGYLWNQFLSPGRNRREDRYGGSAEARRRAPLEAYAAVRRAVGDDFPVFAKLNSSDFVDDGLQTDDSLAFAQELVAAGMDALEISGGIPAAGRLGAVRARIATREDEAYFRAECAAVKRAVKRTADVDADVGADIPVFLVGGLRSPDLIEELLAAGDADGVALCRPLIREPDLPKRWKSGDPARAACISCLGCLKAGMKGGITCVDARKS